MCISRHHNDRVVSIVDARRGFQARDFFHHGHDDWVVIIADARHGVQIRIKTPSQGQSCIFEISFSPLLTRLLELHACFLAYKRPLESCFIEFKLT